MLVFINKIKLPYPVEFGEHSTHKISLNKEILNTVYLKYLNGENLNPIIIDENYQLVKGYYRLIAQKYMGRLYVECEKNFENP
jgi:hypothetical protein